MSELLRNHATDPIAQLLLAHGAGAPMDSPFMNDLSERLARRRIAVTRFEFPFMVEQRTSGRRRPPDRQEILLKTWAEQIESIHERSLPLFIGGKSMGGRMASLWAANTPSTQVRGLLCFGYPFHPPGKPQTLRIDHLPALSVPTLIVQGTRDRLGSIDCVDQLDLPDLLQVHWLDTADHDLKPLRRSSLSEQGALDQAADAAQRFVVAVLASNEQTTSETENE